MMCKEKRKGFPTCYTCAECKNDIIRDFLKKHTLGYAPHGHIILNIRDIKELDEE